MRPPFVNKLILGACLTLASAIAHAQSAPAPQNDAPIQRLTIKTKSTPHARLEGTPNSMDVTAKEASHKASAGGNVTVPKQTQGATFGEIVSSAPHKPHVDGDTEDKTTGATARGIGKIDSGAPQRIKVK